jgi:hypothetical protein
MKMHYPSGRQARCAMAWLVVVATLLASPAVRAATQSLDGTWQIVPDAKNVGLTEHWYEPAVFPAAAARPIQVPGNINEAWPNPTPLDEPGAANLDWYRLAFAPSFTATPQHRYYLRFGAVSFRSEIWLNGVDLGVHDGGQDPFELEVTHDVLLGQLNTLIVRVEAPYFGGITRHVTLVDQPAVRIIDGFARPDAAGGKIHLEVTMENSTGAPATVDLSSSLGEYRPARALGTQAVTVSVPSGGWVVNVDLPVAHPHLWDLDDPFLYTVEIHSHWAGSPSGDDETHLRTGFRDFRIVDGYFQLNGRRILLKSTLGNWYEPVVIQGNARTHSYVLKDLTELKRAGFNTMRMIISGAMPEMMDLADELGFLIYSEHDTSWHTEDPAKFGVSLNGLVRRDRNHPSLVMWGLLNETMPRRVYQRARAWLPSLRAIDPTRLVMLSSGRWDQDRYTGSASNPGSATFDVYLGGEDPEHPTKIGDLPGMQIPAYFGGGDVHIYQSYPTTWEFMMAFERLGQNTRPFLVSEAGDGSLYNPYDEQRKLIAAHAPADAYAYSWINPAIAGLDRTWQNYQLAGIYPSIEQMLIDSELAQSRQRRVTFDFLRANPKVNGFDVTSLNDCWGSGEGLMDNFQDFKPGQLEVLRQGWAPLRWSLLINSHHVYAGQSLHLRASLDNDHTLAAGNYGATFTLEGKMGVVWRAQAPVTVGGAPDAPLAYLVFEQDIAVPDVPAGTYTLRAVLNGSTAVAANTLDLTIARTDALPRLTGTLTACGLDDDARRLLTAQGATVRDYIPGQEFNREVILVGKTLGGEDARWRDLYARIARGAHAVFLSPRVFAGVRGEKKEPLHWLALAQRGELISEQEWLYHKEIVAKAQPEFAGLELRLMTPEYYGQMLADAPFFKDIAPPDQSAAVAIRCLADGASRFIYRDGLTVGSYRYHSGHFTLNGLDVLGQLGHPAADRLLLNLAATAATDAAPLQPLPDEFDLELAGIGIAAHP